MPVHLDFDHNATTRIDPRVRALMVEHLEGAQGHGNPSSIHGQGQRARGQVEHARRQVAAAVGADPLDVVFTSGGTEADNLALFGASRSLQRAGRPHGVLTTALEHPAVTDAARALASEGHPVHWLGVDAEGRVDPSQLADALRTNEDIGIVSLATANHELGNLYDLPAVVRAVRDTRPEVWVHTDAVQALGKHHLRFADWDVDLMSLSAHKSFGPKGAGALVRKRHLELAPLSFGGEQERGHRRGTENTLAILGFGRAAELAESECDARSAHVRGLRARLVQGLQDRTSTLGGRVLGDPDAHVGNTVMAFLPQCPGELMVMALDLEGVCASAGAACSSGKSSPSTVLRGLGFDDDRARCGLRLSLGPDNDESQVDRLLELLPGIVERVRRRVA